MEKVKTYTFLLFVFLVCALCAIAPMFSFNSDDKVLFGLTLDEIQAYVYFGSSGIFSFFVIQYIIKLFTLKISDTDYEKYSDIMLHDGESDISNQTKSRK